MRIGDWQSGLMLKRIPCRLSAAVLLHVACAHKLAQVSLDCAAAGVAQVIGPSEVLDGPARSVLQVPEDRRPDGRDGGILQQEFGGRGGIGLFFL